MAIRSVLTEIPTRSSILLTPLKILVIISRALTSGVYKATSTIILLVTFMSSFSTNTLHQFLIVFNY